MFELVADVERYPEFVPLCEKIAILSRSERGGLILLDAEMTVKYKAVRRSFSSRSVMDRGNLRIETGLIEGPFRRLENLWRFEPVSESESIVRLDVDYELSSRPLQLLAGGIFNRHFSSFSEAFENRASQIYGIQ